MNNNQKEQAQPVEGETAKTHNQVTTGQVASTPTPSNGRGIEKAEKPETLRGQIDLRFEKFVRYVNGVIDTKKFRMEVSDKLIVDEYKRCLEELEDVALKFKTVVPGTIFVPKLKSSTPTADQK